MHVSLFLTTAAFLLIGMAPGYATTTQALPGQEIAPQALQSDDWYIHRETDIPFFGNCGPNAAGAVDGRMASLSCATSATPDVTKMIQTEFGEGEGAGYSKEAESCFVITNTTDNSYFIPMKTHSEWLAFKQAADGGTLGAGVKITSVCPGISMNVCSQSKPLGRGLENAVKSLRVGNLTRSYKCTIDPNPNYCPAWRQLEPPVPDGRCEVAMTLENKACMGLPVHADVSVVLDVSASMGQEKVLSQEALRLLISNKIKPGRDVRLSVVAIGGEGHMNDANKQAAVRDIACNSGQQESAAGQKNVAHIASLASWDGDSIDMLIDGVGLAPYSPIAKAMLYADAEDLKDPARQRFMILLSDGEETCFNNAKRTATVNQLKAKGVKMMGIRFKDNANDTNGALIYAGFDPEFNRELDVTSQDPDNGIFESLDKMFRKISGEECTLEASFYAPGNRATLKAKLVAGQTKDIYPGVYDVKFTLCNGQVEWKNGYVVDVDATLTSTLQCAAAAAAPSEALVTAGCSPVNKIVSAGACSKACDGGTRTVNWTDGCAKNWSTTQSCNMQTCSGLPKYPPE